MYGKSDIGVKNIKFGEEINYEYCIKKISND